MSNVIQLAPRMHQTARARERLLIRAFSQDRRAAQDVFWLKENAELLGILTASGAFLDEAALAPFAKFYEDIEERLRFFPQYYRFLLSICLDLEDLGMSGEKGEELCAWVAQQGLVQAELSDLQRAEAQRLLARRGVQESPDDGLTQRLHTFMARNETFAMPNKKAAYELTHIVFYLSEYGLADPGLSNGALRSLQYAGILAHLDQNADLLAEVCTAMRFAGATPSPLWDQMVARDHGRICLEVDAQAGLNDAYHAYLVTGWSMQMAGQGGFEAKVPAGPLRFAVRGGAGQGALRRLSECMFDLGALRSAEWSRMRRLVLPHLGQEGQQVLEEAEESTEHFEAFFAGFARARAL